MLALEKQYNYYMEHEEELLKKYENQYLVVSEDFVVTAFTSKQEAYYFGAEKYGLGHFLLQFCNYDEVRLVHTVNFKVTA